ncbi:MAG: TonB-dependent receptor, partial [Lysobacter sp.]
MKVRKTILCVSIVAILAASPGLAFAQNTAQDAPADTAQATAPSQDATDIDAVVVQGIRASLQKSLETKRSADAVVEAITAEDIGKFPNTNVAEAMTQIPGVTIDRRFGQGERVSIDGTDPSLNLTFLDGHPLAQTPWLHGEQPNRGFDHTLIASELIGRMEVYKSPEAKLPEGSLGGTVLMYTRKPLDLEANTFNGTLGYSYNDQASKGKPSASGLYSWKNAEETFGFNVAAQHFEERVDRQGVEIFSYVPPSTFPNAAGQVPAGARVPNFVNAAWFQQDRKRDSVALNLQYKPTNELEFNLDTLYIKESFDNYNQSVYNFLSDRANSVDQLNLGANNVVTSGHSGPNARVFYDANARVSEVETKGLDLRASYRGDGWRINGQVGQSKATNDNMRTYLLQSTYTGPYRWDISKGVFFDDVAGSRDPRNWGATDSIGNVNFFQIEAKDQYAQVDFSLNFNGFFNQLEVGVRRHKHEESNSLNVFDIAANTTLADIGTSGYTDILKDFSGFSPSHAHHVQLSRSDVINWVNGRNLDYSFNNSDAGNYLNNTFHVDQTNTAAYAQLNFSQDRLHGNLGLRRVEADIRSSSYELGGTQPVLPPPAGLFVTRRSKNDYWLPSINVVYDLADDWVIRASAAKVVAWAPYRQLVDSTFLDNGLLTGTGGDSKLDPYESNNFNASLEWYFAPESVLALSVFYKDISNFVNLDNGSERYFNSLRDIDPARWNSALLGRNGCTADGFCDYAVLRPRNGGAATIKGLNLALQMPFADTGFGVTGSFTYAKGKSEQGDELPYQSRESVTISPYYEKGALTARISYGWRSHYLAGGYVAGAPPASVDDYTDLGASVGWAFNEHCSVRLDAQNLLNEKYTQYLGDKSLPLNEYTSG